MAFDRDDTDALAGLDFAAGVARPDVRAENGFLETDLAACVRIQISGQDADLAAIKRVIEGTQTVTVYKPLQLIASEAAKLSVKLVKGEKVDYSAKLDNGTKQVDSVLLTPIPLTKENVMKVVEDGFYTKEQVEGK